MGRPGRGWIHGCMFVYMCIHYHYPYIYIYICMYRHTHTFLYTHVCTHFRKRMHACVIASQYFQGEGKLRSIQRVVLRPSRSQDVLRGHANLPKISVSLSLKDLFSNSACPKPFCKGLLLFSPGAGPMADKAKAAEAKAKGNVEFQALAARCRREQQGAGFSGFRALGLLKGLFSLCNSLSVCLSVCLSVRRRTSRRPSSTSQRCKRRDGRVAHLVILLMRIQGKIPCARRENMMSCVSLLLEACRPAGRGSMSG